MPANLAAIIPVAVAMIATAANAVPVQDTRYGRAVLRIEARPKPQQVKDAEARRARENALADAGVQARWIQMVDNYGGPFIDNPYIPCQYEQADQNEAILKQWISEMHDTGMCVMSWYPLSFCRSGWHARPQWRQVYIEPWRAQDFTCCIETGYGDALINFCKYAIDRLGLDGIWFDGSAWTPIWEKPVPLTCACDSCKSKFKADTGLDLPKERNWDDPTFRRWVQWRYNEFGGFIGRLSREIRDQHPDAAVVINHYHRPGIPWQSAIPIDKYQADIISGSEAFSPDTLDLTMRLCRAYGRTQSEVWRPFTLTGEPERNAEPLLEHALISYNAGGFPAFGGDLFDDRMAPTAKLMAPIMNEIHPLVGADTLPYAALHVSQQTETFFYARGEPGKGLGDPYWSSLGLWTSSLGRAHIAPDYVYDSAFTSGTLAQYPVLLMPLSLALTHTQAQTVVEYIRNGGTALLGIAAGQLNEQGLQAEHNPLGQALGFEFDGLPAPDGSDMVNLTLRHADTLQRIRTSGIRTPLRLTAQQWRVLYEVERDAQNEPAAAVRTFGDGRVIVLDTDPATTCGTKPVSGGRTRLYVTDELAKTGRYSLKYEDHNVAPQTFYPDLENRFAPFAAPEFTGGQLTCDLRVGRGADVSIEIRSSARPIAGPIVHLGPAGEVRSAGQTVCKLPPDQWVHIEIDYRFAAADQDASYDLAVTLPDGRVHRLTANAPAARYHRTDWLVVYGAGTAPATFYLDNLHLAGIKKDGARRVALDFDFEEGPDAFRPRTALPIAMARLIKQYAPPPIDLDAPDHVRMGVFQAGDDRLLVHLHNRNGSRDDWHDARGPRAVLNCRFDVNSASSALHEQSFTVRRRNGASRITVPAVGLYEVIDIRR